MLGLGSRLGVTYSARVRARVEDSVGPKVGVRVMLPSPCMFQSKLLVFQSS